MQMCGECMKVYDESEYTKCPFCYKEKDEYTHVIVYDWPDPQKWVQIEIEESDKISIKGGSTYERNPLYC